jgi:hypothetical protein
MFVLPGHARPRRARKLGETERRIFINAFNRLGVTSRKPLPPTGDTLLP